MKSPVQFLTDKSVKEFLVDNESLLFLDEKDPLEVAFKKLVQHQVLAMPVYDTFRGEFKGLIGLLEVVNFIAGLHWELLLESIPYREADMYVRFNQTFVEDLITQPHVKIHDTSNFAVIAKTLLSGDYRRIPVINDQGKVIHVITITQMVDMLYNGITELDPKFLKIEVKDMKHMVPILKKLNDSKLDLYEDSGVIQVNQIAKAIEAFRLIISTHVSAVPIVDGNDLIMGCVSVRHIRAISSNASDIKVLYDEICGEFIKRSSLTVADITVTKNDTLKTVIEKFHSNRIHRLWVIENKKIVGAVTNFSLKCPTRLNALTKMYEQIRNEIKSILPNSFWDDSCFLGPVFIRLSWHASGTYDCISKTGGSNGATMRFSPEKDDTENSGLAEAQKLLEPIKEKYPLISYADLWTLAGVVSVEIMGGPKIEWKPGRVDKQSFDRPDSAINLPEVYNDKITVPDNGRLPDAARGADHIRTVFTRMGFNAQETVALIGAHCVGRAHKDLSGYEGPWTNTPIMFGNTYFKFLKEKTWVPKVWDGPLQFVDKEDLDQFVMMLPSDLALLKDPEYNLHVNRYANNNAAWMNDFAQAYAKLLELGVKRDKVY